MRRPRPTVAVILIAALMGTTGAQAQALIDAGNQAMIMHQGNLLQQHTAPNNEHTNVRKRKGGAASGACSIAQDRERLRPEYERRLGSDGRAAANAWLRREAASLGRQAALRSKAGGRC